jgi:hypothetical protein
MADAREEDRIRQQLEGENGSNDNNEELAQRPASPPPLKDEAKTPRPSQDGRSLEETTQDKGAELASPRNGKTPRPEGGDDADGTAPNGREDKGKEKEEARGSEGGGAAGKATKTPSASTAAANLNAARAYASSKGRGANAAYTDKADLRRYYTAIDRNLREGTAPSLSRSSTTLSGLLFASNLSLSRFNRWREGLIFDLQRLFLLD